MQSQSSLVLLLSVALVSAASNRNLEDWGHFKEAFNKTYESPEEEAYREKVYLENLAEIESLNSQGLSFTAGLNEYSDYTHEERNKMHLGYRKSDRSPTVRRTFEEVNVEDLPKSVNWADQGYVTPVKDQKQCGSCWAFSATGAMEGAHFKATGDLMSLSEQNLVDCSEENCGGGSPQNAFRYVINNQGIDGGEQYPYEGANGECRYATPPAITVTSYESLESGSEIALQKAVAEVGPIAVAIDVVDIAYHYTTGVYDSPNCSSQNLDHAVLVVGYDTDESGQDYWIVKNSWGATWGMNGYMWIARNKGNMCGIATEASYPVV